VGFGNSVLYTVGGALIGTILTVLAGYAASRRELPFRRAILFFFVIPTLVSAGIVPTYIVVQQLGLLDTRWAILLPTAINTFNLIVLINFFKTIPLELEEAALIDGMGYFGILRNIFIPLSVPALATITLYYAVYFWNDWFNALIYLKSEQYPVMMILRNLVNGTMQMDSGNTATERSTVSIALKSAVIITSSVPIVVLYPFLSKYFVKGLTIGGVKG
jgi:putative aldouronate transport system permease protein